MTSHVFVNIDIIWKTNFASKSLVFFTRKFVKSHVTGLKVWNAWYTDTFRFSINASIWQSACYVGKNSLILERKSDVAATVWPDFVPSSLIFVFNKWECCCSSSLCLIVLHSIRTEISKENFWQLILYKWPTSGMIAAKWKVDKLPALLFAMWSFSSRAQGSNIRDNMECMRVNVYSIDGKAYQFAHWSEICKTELKRKCETREWRLMCVRYIYLEGQRLRFSSLALFQAPLFCNCSKKSSKRLDDALSYLTLYEQVHSTNPHISQSANNFLIHRPTCRCRSEA